MIRRDAFIYDFRLDHFPTVLWTQHDEVDLSFRHIDGSSLKFFRNEITTEIRWAGTTEKQISHGPLGPRAARPRGFGRALGAQRLGLKPAQERR